MHESTQRLFFALWPSKTLRQTITAHSQDWLQSLPCRSVAPADYHITLAFLGVVPRSRVDALTELGHSLPLAPCRVELDQLTIWHRARVLVLTASHVPELLLTFVDVLQAKLRALGFVKEERPYRPHITLARDARGKALEQTVTPLTWDVAGYVLVESVAPNAAGERYKVIERFGGGP